MSSSGGEGEARKLFDGAYTAGEIFLTSTTLQLKAKAKRSLYLGKAATSGTIENVRASSARTEAEDENTMRNISSPPSHPAPHWLREVIGFGKIQGKEFVVSR